MEREANYAAVGAFVLLVLAMAGLFVYWYADSRDARDYTRYEVYFDGSVSGLTVGSTVRYLGVDIGRVRSMHIDPRSATRVQVVVDIDSTAPVSQSTVAELSLQGVTGLLYIDLLGRAGAKKLADPVPSEHYPVIRSVRSGFDAFVSGLPDVVARAAEAAQRFTLLLSEENVDAITALVGNLEKASRTVPGTVRDAQLLINDLRGAVRDVSAVAASIHGLTDEATPEIKATLQRVRVVADNLASTSARLDEFVAANQADVRGFTRDGLPELTRLVRDSREAAAEFEALARSLRENPSQLIYQPVDRGVEIPR
jgi:phospholipid/cholesterol/gamma-HCH transport system substrate-binding protein